MSATNYPRIQAAVLKWTTSKERHEIAARFNVMSRGQISNVLRGKSINVPLLDALFSAAEANKARQAAMPERADKLLTA